MKKRFKALLDNSPCFGLMEIMSKTDKTAYLIWSIYDGENKLIASLSNNYFLGKENGSDEEIFNIVKDQIPKYRIGRKKAFTNVKLED